MKKRIISLLMALLMLTSLLPTAVWAEGDTPEQAAAAATDSGTVEQEPAAPETPETPVEPEQPTEPEQSAELEADAEPDSNGIALYNSATSGSCGDNVAWSYDANSCTLTISGSGDMEDYDATYDRDDETYYNPTYPWPSSVAKLVVKDGVTRLGSFAFYKCTSLVEVSLPESIGAFGSYCFAECSQLISLTIPSKVTVIPQGFCSGCKKITAINIPSGVTRINKNAFLTTGITTLTIPTSVVYIGTEIGNINHVTYEGSKTQWEKIEFGSYNNFEPTSRNTYAPAQAEGTFTNSQITWEVECDYCLRITGFGDIPDFNLGTAPWYDYNTQIKEVVIERNITRIGNYAFYNLKNLKEFRSLGEDMVTHVAFSVKTIGESAFELCTALSTFPFSEMEQLESVGKYSFHSSGLSGDITFPDSLKCIEHGAFENTSINSVIIRKNVATIGQFAFNNCSKLTDIFYRGTQAQWESLISGEDNKVPSRTILHLNSRCCPGYSTKTVDPIPATCTTSGSMNDTVCATCGVLVSKGTVILATGHTEVVDAAKAPTCTETGLTEGKHCSVCDTVLVAQEEVPATGHTEVVDAAKAATCTETGLTGGKHCSVCNTVLVAQEVVPAKGHTEVIDPAKAATCTETGLTEGKHCSVCDTVLVAQEVVPATGHIWDDGVVSIPATGHKTGTLTFTCTACHATRTEEIPAIKGDVNGDGTVDILDVDHVYRHLTGQITLSSVELAVADVNRDGTLDVYDLQLLYEAVAQGTEL